MALAIQAAFIAEDGRNIADAMLAVARALNRLGNADATTPVGGLEALGAVLKDAIEYAGDNLDSHGTAVMEVAEALLEVAKNQKEPG